VIPDRDKIHKILVIKFGGIGDILLATAVLPNLKYNFPNAQIYFLTLRHSRDVLIDNPFITRVFTYDPNEDKSWCLLKNIRRQKYDLVIDLFGNPRTALITFWSRAKYRFGFKFRGRSYAYNITAEGRGGEVHNVEFNLDALRAMDIPIINKNLSLSVTVVHEEFAESFIRKHNIDSKPIIGITLTGGWEAKRFKPPDYVKLMKMINELYDVNFILIWGNKRELGDAEFIMQSCEGNCYIIPDSPIRYLGAIIKRCSIIIGNDSGPLHIAVAVGVPTLGIYGPTNPHLQGPYGEKNLTIVKEELECLYCNLLECPIGNICMTELSHDLIIDKLKQLIDINNIPVKKNKEIAL
jgi:ADP-heptose:LPS heptosyltransferase